MCSDIYTKWNTFHPLLKKRRPYHDYKLNHFLGTNYQEVVMKDYIFNLQKLIQNKVQGKGESPWV